MIERRIALSLRCLTLAVLLTATARAQGPGPWDIETIAGSGNGFDGDSATAGRLLRPNGLAIDRDGNIYIADYGNHRIRMIDGSGGISTFAGTGEAGYGEDGDPATAAGLNRPSHVVVDDDGNVYIADTFNRRVLKVDGEGTVSTFAGTGEYGFGGDGGFATNALLRAPRALTIDEFGNVYIADSSDNRIRRVDAAGRISTFAGTGNRGFSGDGGFATAARLSSPRGLAVDRNGGIYIADSDNHRIRRVDAAGTISTFAGTGENGFSGDGRSASEAQLNSPRHLDVDQSGNVFIADRSNHRVRRVDTSGTISTIAGAGQAGFSGDGGVATEARLNYPTGLVIDHDGNLLVAEFENRRIRKIDTAQTISTVAGSGDLGDNGAAREAQFYFPSDVVTAYSAGNLYIADTWNNRIRWVDNAGRISTFAGTGERGFSGDGGPARAARLMGPRALTISRSGTLYIADTSNHRIRRVDALGRISTFAGTGEGGFSGDGGLAISARFRFPYDLAIDRRGNVYIADRWNHRIRRVDASGRISTFAGTGEGGFSGDGGPASEAQLRYPAGLAIDESGNVYIADSSNHRIRRVDAAGTISTFAGTGKSGFSGDGGPASAAQLSGPLRVAVDGSGNLYVADRGNHRIRRIAATGGISTIAGSRFRGFGGDGGLATTAALYFPYDVSIGTAGDIYISDSDNHRIRKLSPSGSPLIADDGVVLATGTPNVTTIAPGAVVSVLGDRFAPTDTVAFSSPDASGQVPAILANTCLEVRGTRVPLLAVWTHQINAQAPTNLATGSADVVVIRDCDAEGEKRSPAATVRVTAASPAFFNLGDNPDGNNPITAWRDDGRLAGVPGLVPGLASAPARPGEFVTIYGTGFGRTNPPIETGRIPRSNSRLVNPASFSIGGITLGSASVRYAGAARCCLGVYRFELQVPPNAPDGHLPVRAATGGATTPQGPYLTVRR